MREHREHCLNFPKIHELFPLLIVNEVELNPKEFKTLRTIPGGQ